MRHNSINLYAIQEADLTDCSALFVKVFNNPPWNETWREETVVQRLIDCALTPGFYGLCVRSEGQLIGFALGHIELWDKARHFYLKEMCVATERQNMGIGTALMEALEEGLRQRGVAKIYLHTARETAAQAFYGKRGFYVSPKMIMMSKRLIADEVK